jgi:hypothetical protein
LVNGLIADPNAALVAISIVAGCGAAWMIYLLTDLWFGRGPALVSMALFLVSPLCWFHGAVALTYIVEAFFSALIGYLCWRVYTGEAGFAVPASLALAVAAGFRPSTALFLGPLCLMSIRKTGWRQRLLSIAAMVLGVLGWFVPMTRASGGIGAYFGSLAHLWSMVPGRRTTLDDPFLAIARLFTIAWIFVLCFGAASLLVFFRTTISRHTKPDRRGFIWCWTAPGLFFFAFVFLSYVNSGYLLVLCPPLFAILAARVCQFIGAPQNRVLRWGGAAAGIAANCAFFAFAPVYCSHKGIREFERDMGGITRDLSQAFDPKTTLIIGFDSHFLGYRHAGYYLPAFVTIQYPEVAYPDGKRVFVMHGRDTQLVTSLPLDGFRQFVFFPLPAGAEYSAYLHKVRGLLPNGALSTTTLGGKVAATGPAWAISGLFQSTTAASGGVYTPLNQRR